jgi:hypothetical protein
MTHPSQVFDKVEVEANERPEPTPVDPTAPSERVQLFIAEMRKHMIIGHKGRETPDSAPVEPTWICTECNVTGSGDAVTRGLQHVAEAVLAAVDDYDFGYPRPVTTE